MNKYWLIFGITIALSAFFSGMEIAFFSSNKLRIEIERQKGHLSGKIFGKFLNKPSDLIATLLIGNNIALVLYGIAIAAILKPLIINLFPSTSSSEGLMMIAQTVLATLIILVLGEFLPKMLFRANPNSMMSLLAVPTMFFHYLFYPLAILFIWMSKLLLKAIVGINIDEEKYAFSTLDLDNYLLEFSHDNEEKKAYEDEIQMIQNAMDLRTVKLRECMIPRTELATIEINDDLSELNQIFMNSGHSKILIYKDNIDNIIGYVHAFDLFKEPKSISDIIRPVLIVPESMLANKVMERFIKERKSLGVVVDEFGGTAGMVTLEDVIEEIFGEIQDEFDKEELFEKRLAEDEFIFAARLEIHYLNEIYGFIMEESEEYSTLAGYIIHFHESIPVSGEVITIHRYRFTVLEVSDTRLIKVRMKIIG